MKLNDKNITVIVAFWAGLLKKSNPPTAYPSIMNFLHALKNLLQTFNTESNIALKVSVGSRKFTPEKSLFADIFNRARTASALPISYFVYGASLTVELDNQIMVKDGFYELNYQYVPNPADLAYEDSFNLPKYQNPQLALNSEQDKSPKIEAKKVTKRFAVHSNHQWHFKESKYMRVDLQQQSFFNQTAAIASQPNIAKPETDEFNLNECNLDALFETYEQTKVMPGL